MVGIACVSVYYTNGLVFDSLDMNFGVVSFNTEYSDQACVCVTMFVWRRLELMQQTRHQKLFQYLNT